MIVQCVTLATSSPDPTVPTSGELTVGKKYQVFGVYGASSNIKYRLVGDDGRTPGLHDAQHFEMWSHDIPKDWTFRLHGDASWELTPDAFGQHDFWEAYFDGEEWARALFNDVVSATDVPEVPVPASEEQLDAMLAKIKKRYETIFKGNSYEEAFLLHVRTLGTWQEEPLDHPDVTAEFPQTLPVAFAVCHPDCGAREFIVEGSTQECQRCGRLMFRNATRYYELKCIGTEPDFTATVRLLSVKEGGRRIATPSNFLGCIVRYENADHECRIFFEERPMTPGEQRAVAIKLLWPELLIGKLSPGSSFYIKEGGRKIAEGVVVRLGS